MPTTSQPVKGSPSSHTPNNTVLSGPTMPACAASGAPTRFEARVRIDTPKEREYFQHGGILQYVLRQLAGAGKAA